MGQVIVAGGINMDVVVKAPRHPLPGETVQGSEAFIYPGGKGANQAVAASRLGVPTAMIGCIGGDAFGSELRLFLTREGIDLSALRSVADAATGLALITLAKDDNTIVVAPGANMRVGLDDVMAPALAAGDVLVSPFEIPLLAIESFFGRARDAGARTVLNPAPAVSFDRDLLLLSEIVVLNEIELAAISGATLTHADPDARFVDAARSIAARSDQTICVTLGARGAVALVGDEIVTIPGRAVRVADTTGAGDCFVGVLAAQLARGAAIRPALHYANAAASLCVQRIGAGTAMPQAGEIEAIMALG